MAKPLKLAVLVSGGGTNLQAIIDSINDGKIIAKIEIVISTKKNAYALKRAEKHQIPCQVCSPKDFTSNDEFSNEISKIIDSYKADLIALAGFMSILSSSFIKKYENRIMNTHPSLLPSFGGKGFYGDRVHKAVLDYGVKISGATIMFVSEEVDKGPIILQQAISVDQEDTIKSLSEKVLPLEHKLYPLAIKLFSENRLEVKGRVVNILTKERKND